MTSGLSSIPSRFVQRASIFASSITGGKSDVDGLPQEADHQSQLKVLQGFRDYVQRGVGIPLDVAALSGIVDAIRHSNAIDDRKMLLEHVLVFLSKLPAGDMATKLQNAVVELLYNDLPHPPATYVDTQYAWRTADGSYNNLSDPNMGKAGTPYARSVQQTHPLPRDSLPDAGLVFDTLLKREKFVQHPAGLSSLMFAFAAVVIHTVFRTSHENVNINETSSYVDLAPLYGNNQDGQNKVRTRNGRGYLHPDVFAEDRLLLLPPAVSVILVLFNRNHNYIAQKLLEINERGTYVDPDSIPSDDPTRATKLQGQEEDLFQTARLINATWFASAVFSDYFSAILGLVRQGSSWSLNPFGEIRKADHSLFERGRGNVCSVEFNCLYRWHATTSEKDEEWVHEVFEKIFPGKTPDELSIADFKATAKKYEGSMPDVTHWTFGELQRQPDGRFRDADLAKILQDATSRPAGAFRARGTPHIMRLHEIMGIEQNRRWGVCSLNDFRKFLGLKPYATFLEWNSNPEIAEAAQKLYGDIELLELYAGLQAEEAKPVVDGAGLCPSYTISRAILSDAIALTRGDRFFTADYTPFNMTAWGFADCQRDPTAPGYGSTLGRLFLRALPDHYSHNSTYTWFPLMTPGAMGNILTNLGDIKKYDLGAPKEFAGVPRVTSYRDVVEVLKNPKKFAAAHQARATFIVKGEGFFIASDNPARAEREQRDIIGALTGVPGSVDKITEYFFQKTRELVTQESNAIVGSTTKTVDLARDVLKFVPIYWAAELAGIPLKTKEDPDDDAYSVQELHDQLTDIYSYLFLDVDQSKLLTLRDNAKAHIKKLLEHITASYGGSRLSISGIFDTFANVFKHRTDHDDLKERFSALGYDSNTVANAILAIVVGATVELSQALIHLVNFFLDDSKPSDVQTLTKNAKLDVKNESILQNLVLEALRLDPAFSGVYREATNNQSVGVLKFKSQDFIFVDIGSANRDPEVFPDPASVDVSRSPKELYLVGDGSEKTLGREITTKIMCHVLRAIFSLPKLRRAPGQSGVLKRYALGTTRTSKYVYLGRDQKPTPWATTFAVQYD